jgi:hypothetical protein
VKILNEDKLRAAIPLGNALRNPNLVCQPLGTYECPAGPTRTSASLPLRVGKGPRPGCDRNQSSGFGGEPYIEASMYFQPPVFPC